MSNQLRIICVTFERTPFFEHDAISFMDVGAAVPEITRAGDSYVEPKVRAVNVYLGVPYFEDTDTSTDCALRSNETAWRMEAQRLCREKFPDAIFRGGPAPDP